MQQREGRIIRQGNENKEVDIYTYVTEGTFDSYLYQMVERKQKFIAQIMTSKTPVRIAEDVDETALSYAEVKSLATGNPFIKEKMDLDIEVTKLKMLKSYHLSEKYNLEDKVLKEFPIKINSLELNIKGYLVDMEHLKNNTHLSQDKDEPAFSPMTIQGNTYLKKSNAGEALIQACKDMTNAQPKEIGEYRGFKMSIYFDSFGKQFKMQLINELRHMVELGNDVFGNITRIDNVLDGFENKLENCKELLHTTQSQLESAKQEMTKPFAFESELADKTARLDELNIIFSSEEEPAPTKGKELSLQEVQEAIEQRKSEVSDDNNQQKEKINASWDR